MKVDELVEIANTVASAFDGVDDFDGTYDTFNTEDSSGVPREVILQMLNGIQPGTIFDNAVSQKRVQGWTWGRELNEDLLRDPKVVAYGELDPQFRMVFEAVHAVVYALRFYVETDKVDSGLVVDEDGNEVVVDEEDTNTEWNKFTPLKDPVTT